MAAAGLNGRPWRRIRAEIIAAGTHCAICGQPVDKTITGRHPLAPSVDHILPRTHGGTHTRSNLRLTHYGCNARRGDGTRPRGERRVRRAPKARWIW